MQNVMLLACIEATFFCNQFTAQIACDIKLPALFARTAMYGRDTPLYEREAVAVKILNASNHFWNTFTWTACIVLNYVMANDFVLSLIRPMEKH